MGKRIVIFKAKSKNPRRVSFEMTELCGKCLLVELTETQSYSSYLRCDSLKCPVRLCPACHPDHVCNYCSEKFFRCASCPAKISRAQDDFSHACARCQKKCCLTCCPEEGATCLACLEKISFRCYYCSERYLPSAPDSRLCLKCTEAVDRAYAADDESEKMDEDRFDIDRAEPEVKKEEISAPAPAPIKTPPLSASSKSFLPFSRETRAVTSRCSGCGGTSGWSFGKSESKFCFNCCMKPYNKVRSEAAVVS